MSKKLCSLQSKLNLRADMTRESKLASHRRRLENLEATLATEGRPFPLWGMAGEDSGSDLRFKTELELNADIRLALAAGAMWSLDRPIVVVWKLPRDH
ncbi:hypothetical protein SAMN05216330_104458 [Bradyrhizobium sp. Ghvi]|uniref:hypothetical protein n=1 Tax=Bradyrhizobium sp. Ghvi TaxID=1855319 RepID=UPI0008E4DC01|nr:hypothetical protein [Bradyrhizobium sp. Ghvi]SFO74350.1 hypothetical protein SAMN05216330_104458 [Bradyrhizobium sp. Ghvi]